MEFQASEEAAENELVNYFASAGSKTTVSQVTLCKDRDNPEILIQIVEFNSYEDAMVNNELDATQEASKDEAQIFGEIAFRNLDVLSVHKI
tara:strand:- start:216 stop:488 length:273 start_codon:yes stop_codon:yes gene_type:complete